MTEASSKDPFEGAYTFKGLAMWQRGQEVANDALDLVEALPNTRTNAILAQQIVKAATSIAANVAEGHARYSPGAYRNHLSIARGSTAELISWLDLLKRRSLLSPEREQRMLAKCAEIMKMLTAKMIQLDKQTGTTRFVRDEQEEYVLE